jgi:hypothetical protein
MILWHGLQAERRRHDAQRQFYQRACQQSSERESFTREHYLKGKAQYSQPFHQGSLI